MLLNQKFVYHVSPTKPLTACIEILLDSILVLSWINMHTHTTKYRSISFFTFKLKHMHSVPQRNRAILDGSLDYILGRKEQQELLFKKSL